MSRGWVGRHLGLVAAGVALMASSASAHLMSSGHGTLNVVDGKAFIVLSLPVAVFARSEAAAAVADGVLTRAELRAHGKALKAAIRAGLRVKAGATEVALSSILLNLPKGADHAPGQGTELVMMIVAPLGADAQPVTLASSLWAKGAEALKVRATQTAGRETIRSEVAELTPLAPRHRFFGPATGAARAR